jgi:hypothetical protein
MPLESRTRITLLLPAPKTYPQYLLVDKVLPDLDRVCGGVTLSTVSGGLMSALAQGLS